MADIQEYQLATDEAKNAMFTSLFDKYGRDGLARMLRVAATAGMHQKNLQEAESSFYDVFQIALERFDATKGAAFTTYLNMLIQSKVTDLLRKQGREDKPSLESLADPFEGDVGRLIEMEDRGMSDLDRQALEEALVKFQYRCGSEALSVHERSDFADLVFKLQSLENGDEIDGVILTALERGLLFRLMARVERNDQPTDALPLEGSAEITAPVPARLNAFTRAFRRADYWRRWESKTVTKAGL